ncbi:Uncharacterised protein [Mycobacterium tuberculosis]|nr:Uncharacterised protein [Mycobacterium tuberculosis]
MQVRPGSRQRPVGDFAEPPQGFGGVSEQLTGVGEMLDQRWDVSEHPIQRVVAVGDDGQELVG